MLYAVCLISSWVLLDAGPGAVNFILDHAEIDFVFVQDKKVKEVRLKILDMHFGCIILRLF